MFSSHCQCHPELLSQKLILWDTIKMHGKSISFIYGLQDDTGQRREGNWGTDGAPRVVVWTV